MSLTQFRKPVVVATENDFAVDAARKLRDAHVGCVIVTRDSRPVGILTDRDLTVRLLAEQRDPAATRIAEIMTYDPISIRDDSEVAVAAERMRAHGIRRLPLVNEKGNVTGIVTADELVTLLSRALANLGEGIAESADACDSR